jgi:hypothetical protein
MGLSPAPAKNNSKGIMPWIFPPASWLIMLPPVLATSPAALPIKAISCRGSIFSLLLLWLPHRLGRGPGEPVVTVKIHFRKSLPRNLFVEEVSPIHSYHFAVFTDQLEGAMKHGRSLANHDCTPVRNLQHILLLGS